MNNVVNTVNDLKRRYDELSLEEEKLKEVGFLHALPFWKSKKYLYLLYTDTNGQRQRRYVGCNPAKIDAAFEEIQRAEQYDKLIMKLEDIKVRFSIIEDNMREIRAVLLDPQAKI